MSLIRLIVIALIIYLLVQIFKRWVANKKSNSSEKQDKLKQMVRCEVCQLHIPEEEALQRDGKFYCSQKHLDGKSD
jgi:uncharacterized protein